MRRASVLIAILQSAAFQTLNHLLIEYITTDSFWSPLIQDPVFQDYNKASKVYWDARHRNESLKHVDEGNTGQAARLELPAPSLGDKEEGTLSVSQTIDATGSAEHQSDDSESKGQSKVDSEPESATQADNSWRKIALGCLRTFITQVLLGPLLYTWHIWLERLFPSRRSARQSDGAYQVSKEKEVDDDDTREEQVIQKWLRQGKIHRASLSWRNTFAKWAIQWTLGRYWMDNAEGLLKSLMRRDPPVWVILVPTTYVFRWVSQRVFTAPFGTILCFVLVPAPKRLPFLSGVTLLWTIFIATFLYLITPMVIQTEFMQVLLSNMTNTLETQPPYLTHAIDEL